MIELSNETRYGYYHTSSGSPAIDNGDILELIEYALGRENVDSTNGWTLSVENGGANRLKVTLVTKGVINV